MNCRRKDEGRHKIRETLCKRLNKKIEMEIRKRGSRNKGKNSSKSLSTKLDSIFETLLIQNSITCSIQALNFSVTVKAPFFRLQFCM